ncbi:hypothetical protein [Pseudoxanthomonas putridarboris]|uniref:Transmembrane protein n=1 Tax=Pseudoxanthomonas putridarboris TaxID=752605 RepID=A0ABU9IWH8_9GAMM
MPTFHVHVPAAPHQAPDPRLDRALRNAVLTGLVVVLLVPLARANTAWLGWLPLWLVGMPAAAWWALHRFRLPRWPGAGAAPAGRRRRGRGRGRAQARRRSRPAQRAGARAA